MGSGFLIMLREGLEAALIVAIILAYLKTLDRRSDFGLVWAGTGAAVLGSMVAGVIIFAAVGELEGPAEEITEGLVALVAVGVLTWMIFWMGRQARFIKGELQTKVDAAVARGSATALAGIAFVAVVREGLESALFLLSTTVGTESNAAQLGGGLIGVAAAAGVGYLVYKGSRKINLRFFFRITGVLIILFAGGLLASAVHEFQEVGAIGTLEERVYDVGAISTLNPGHSQMGEFLNGLFGWSPAPSIEMLLAYFVYLIPVGAAFLRSTRKVPARMPAPVREPTQTQHETAPA